MSISTKHTLFLSLVFCLAIQHSLAYKHQALLTCYNKSEYSAGRQNWDISIDGNGVAYFANSDGLLYNVYGEWGFYPIPENEFLRTVYSANDTIWCGGSGFGYFTKTNGYFTYHKLGTTGGEPIWNTEIYKDYIVFQSEKNIILFNRKTKKTETSDFEKGIWAITKWHDKLWVILRDGNLGYYANGEFKVHSQIKQLVNHEVRKLFVHNDILYILMFEGQLFRFDGFKATEVKLPLRLQKRTLFTGLSYDANSYCLGTVSDGFVQISNDGEIISWVNTQQGLIDNTVLSLEHDDLGNMWLGLDYGIAKLELQSPINPIFNGGATYAIKEYQGTSYLATNKGLFYCSDSGEFDFLENTGGQVWSLKEFEHQFFISHNRGLFSLQNGELSHLINYVGVMDISHFKRTNYFLVSSYHGLILMEWQAGRLTYKENLQLFGITKLFYDSDNNCMWGSTKDRQIVKLSLLANSEIKVEHIPQKLNMLATNLGAYFCDSLSLLRYSENKFDKADIPLLKGLDRGNIQALHFNTASNAVAFVQSNELKLHVMLPDGKIHSYNSLLKSLGPHLNEGYEYVDFERDQLRIATDRGVSIFDFNFQAKFKKFSDPVISSVTILNEDNRKLFFPFSNNKLALEQGNKDLVFKFNNNKSRYSVAEYRYRIEPKEKEWSDWTSKQEAVYSQLRGGDYSFRLQSRINNGSTHETKLKISIDKLWYQTAWIILPIALLVSIWVFGIIIVMTRINKRNLKKQKALYVEKNAHEILRIKNEQLLQYTEIISRKNEFLNTLKFGLEAMRNAESKRWANMIAEEVSMEKKDFIFHKLFSEVHQDFIARITEAYPSLTANDIRILSFIRTNLDNKEISNLMNITSRSLDTSRYRLRKKLNLESGEDLNLFVRNF